MCDDGKLLATLSVTRKTYTSPRNTDQHLSPFLWAYLSEFVHYQQTRGRFPRYSSINMWVHGKCSLRSHRVSIFITSIHCMGVLPFNLRCCIRSWTDRMEMKFISIWSQFGKCLYVFTFSFYLVWSVSPKYQYMVSDYQRSWAKQWRDFWSVTWFKGHIEVSKDGSWFHWPGITKVTVFFSLASYVQQSNSNWVVQWPNGRVWELSRLYTRAVFVSGI